MSTEEIKKDNDQIETPTSGESRASDEANQNQKEPAANLGASRLAVSEELLSKLADLCERNSEATINQNKRLEELTQQLTSIKDDIEKKKPLNIQAEVTGFYNYEKRQKEIVDEFEIDDRARAKTILSRIRGKYPES